MHDHDDHDDHAHGDHDHGHAHDHHHEGTHPEVPRAQPVVLELGDGVGALIVYTEPELLGTEVEISPADDDDSRTHKDVLERLTGAGSMHALVYDNLAEGEYTLWIDDVPKARGVRVSGGAVAELDWRQATSA